jgi:predicted negative regulator of RcsB-dependent stress response
MDVHASEKEQVEALKTWWKDNGSSVVTGVLLGLSVLLGGKAWQSYQQRQVLTASNTYAQMMALAAAGDNGEAQTEQAQALANELISNHSGSTYASLAALLLARQAVDHGELPAAQAQLQWALEHAGSAEIRHTAATRLIRLMIDQQLYDDAERQLAAVQDAGAYAYLYSELKGDLAVARGQPSAAVPAYRQALDEIPAEAPNLALLTAKYESVSGDGDTP